MEEFIEPMIYEITEVFCGGNNTCSSSGSGNNNNCSTSGN